MGDSEATFAWRMFNLNWLPIVLMGAMLLGVVVCTDFSLEPVGFGVTIAIGISLVLIAYGSACTFADLKLIFWFGSTAQLIITAAIVGPLSYVGNALSWPLQDQTLLLIDRAIGLDPSIDCSLCKRSQLAREIPEQWLWPHQMAITRHPHHFNDGVAVD
ncbi:hypothetical protein [Bradyrhizobium sp.]|uniref:hypothetical protein n=1 Tax=Bradyrhizobium sp. TaxID=376 RepID=UPI00261E9040|nr:hypothetical protein [Bradyrhizobium sp.]